MDVTEWEYKEFSGKPHDGQDGYYIGFDADLQPYLLKWSRRNGGFWMAATLDAVMDGAEPIAHALDADHKVQIVKWASLPLRWSELDRANAAEHTTPLSRDRLEEDKS